MARGQAGRRRPELDGQIRRGQLTVRFPDQQPFDHVPELADVPGPVVRQQRLHQVRRQLRHGHSVQTPVMFEEVLHQQRNVLLPLAQGRNRDVNDVEPVIQVLPERPGSNLLQEVTVGRGHEPDVHRRMPLIGPDALNFAGLQEPQEQGLHAQAHLADLVHEQRSAVGQLQHARPVAKGAGEAAARMAEQLRLEERLRDTGTVEGDERGLRAPAGPVQPMGDDFLADPALSSNQHFGVGTRRVPNVFENRADSHTCPDQLFVPVLVHIGPALRAAAKAAVELIGRLDFTLPLKLCQARGLSARDRHILDQSCIGLPIEGT